MRPHFSAGDRVRVRVAQPRGHCHTPTYCRGKAGVVERVCGEFRTPEALAYGRDGLPKAPLYRVRFAQPEVWPDYQGPKDDTIDVEIYEHWLEPA